MRLPRFRFRFGVRTLLCLVLLFAMLTAAYHWPTFQRHQLIREIRRRGGTIARSPQGAVVEIRFPAGSQWPEVGELQLFQTFPQLESVAYGRRWHRRKMFDDSLGPALEGQVRNETATPTL